MVASATSKLLEAAGLLVYVVVALLIGVGAAHCQTTSAERATIGGTMLRPDSDTTLRLQGLATSGGSDLLFLDAEGDVRQRLLAVGDLPAVVGRTNTANDWTALQTFSAGIALRDGTCSAGAGALYFTADTDTGLARSGGNAIVVCTGGSTRLTVNNTGTTAAGTLTSSGAFTASTTASVGSTLGVTGLATLTGGFAAGANSTITGNLTASGDVAVNGGDITSSAGTLNLDAGGIVQINDALVMASANTIRSSNFASRTTGWGITYAGEADFRYTYADEFYTKNFIADLETALNGGQVIAKSTVVVAVDFTCPAAGGTATLRVRDFPGHTNLRVFAANDWVVLRSLTRADADSDGNIEFSIADCVGQVTSYSDQSDDTQTWTFTRGSGGNAGAMASSTVVAADALAIDYGVSGQGFLVARANDGTEGAQSPYWQVVTWTTSPVAANMAPRTRWGNLNGAYGYSAQAYGFAAGNPADAFISVDDTNGIRIIEGGSTVRGQWATDGSILIGNNGGTNNNVAIDATALRLRRGTTDFVTLSTSGLLMYDSGGNQRVSLDATNGLILGRVASGQGNVVADTSGNLRLRSNTVTRVELTASNGAIKMFDESAVQFFSLDGTNGLLFGNWYTTGSNKGYAQMTDRYFRLCKTGVGCTLEFDGNTGGITSTGSLSIQGAATIGGSGSFAGSGITIDATGIRSSVPTSAFADGSSYRFAFTNGVTQGGTYAYDTTTSSVLASLLSGTSGSDDYRISQSASNGSFGFASTELSSGPTSLQWSALVTNTSTGDSTNLAMTPTSFSVNGSAGETETITVRNSAGTGTCTIVFTLGWKTGGTC